MADMTTTINGLHGTIKIDIRDEQDGAQRLTFDWCKFDDQNTFGFITSFTDVPIMLTEVAAEQFLRIVVTSLIRSLDIKPGYVTILNHLGEELQDVQFLPPTVEGTEADLTEFVAAQQTLEGLFSLYEQTGELSPDIVKNCEMEGVLEDFLCLVQIRTSGLQLAINKPEIEEN